MGQNVLTGSVFNALTLGVAVLAAVLTALTAFYQRRSLWPPRRRLTVTWQRPVALLSRTVEGIRVAVDDVQVADAHVVRISVANTGKNDITSAMFDQRRPVRLKFGVPVVGIIDAVSAGGPVPAHALEGSQVSLGPDLLARSQVIDFQVLTDGRPRVRCEAYLADTNLELREERRGLTERPVYQLLERFSWVPASIAVGAVVGILTSTTTLVPIQGSAPPVADLPVPDVRIEPQTAAPGAVVVVTGDDFVIETGVEVIVECPTAASPLVGVSSNGTTTADEDGDFRIELRLPDDPSMPNPDTCVVRAQQRFTESVHMAAQVLIARR